MAESLRIGTETPVRKPLCPYGWPAVWEDGVPGVGGDDGARRGLLGPARLVHHQVLAQVRLRREVLRRAKGFSLSGGGVHEYDWARCKIVSELPRNSGTKGQLKPVSAPVCVRTCSLYLRDANTKSRFHITTLEAGGSGFGFRDPGAHLVADVAIKGFLPRVRADVHAQVALLGELLAARLPSTFRHFPCRENIY